MKLAELHRQFNGCCVYCGAETKLNPSAGERNLAATRDHFIPRKAGGKNGPGNEVLACFPCNQGKGQLDPRLIIDIWSRLDENGLDIHVARVKTANAVHAEAEAKRNREQRGLTSRCMIAAFAATKMAMTVAAGRYFG